LNRSWSYIIRAPWNPNGNPNKNKKPQKQKTLLSGIHCRRGKLVSAPARKQGCAMDLVRIQDENIMAIDDIVTTERHTTILC